MCVYIYIYIYIYIYTVYTFIYLFIRFFFISGSYIYVKLFHVKCIEKDLYIATGVKLLNLNIAAW